ASDDEERRERRAVVGNEEAKDRRAERTREAKQEFPATRRPEVGSETDHPRHDQRQQNPERSDEYQRPARHMAGCKSCQRRAHRPESTSARRTPPRSP